MSLNTIPIFEGITSGETLATLSVTSGHPLIRIHITTEIDAYISQDDLYGDILVSHGISRRPPILSEAYKTMLASEAVLSRDWNNPDEDAAWANL